MWDSHIKIWGVSVWHRDQLSFQATAPPPFITQSSVICYFSPPDASTSAPSWEDSHEVLPTAEPLLEDPNLQARPQMRSPKLDSLRFMGTVVSSQETEAVDIYDSLCPYHQQLKLNPNLLFSKQVGHEPPNLSNCKAVFPKLLKTSLLVKHQHCLTEDKLLIIEETPNMF
jgi:hypothetical protein